MPQQNSLSKSNPKAIVAVIIAFFFLACVSALTKLQVSYVHIAQIVFVQFSTCLLISVVIASKNKFRDLKSDKLKYQIVRGAAGVFAFAACAVAMSTIPLVNAVLLNNSAPLFIPIITLIWLKTKIDEKIWYGIVTGFIGIIFILKPTSEALLKTSDMYGLASGILLAIAYVALKILTRTESLTSVIFYYSLIGVILSLPFAILNWKNPPLIIFCYGILAGILFMGYMFTLQYAYSLMEALKLAPFNYIVIVFTGIFDWLFFGHIPDVLSVIGIVLVSAGGLLAITLHEKDNKQLKHHWHF
jgi:drug/metabolite transporter (DMT)-like permease